MTKDELERQAFEEWFEPRQKAMKGLGLISINRLKQKQWEAWKARARQESNDE